MSKPYLVFALLVSVLVFQVGNSLPAPDDDDDGDFDEFKERVKNDFHEKVESVYGGSCGDDDMCSLISYCKKTNDSVVGTCQLTWWIILAAILLVFLFLVAFCACICCPCCLLYACCESCCCC